MVYDPIRDCDVPSPAASLQNPSPWADVTPGSERLSASTSYPPGFRDSRSPGVFRSSSGGIRNLINDEGTGQDSRPSSVHGSFSSVGPEDHPPPRNRGINSLLNEGAPPISQSSSASSMAYTTHSHHSPGPKPYSLLDHDGFLAPTTPASGFARSSRSPYPHHSPAPGMMNLPHEITPNTYRSPHPYGYEGLPLRSPSVSVSPRHQLHNLPPHHLPSRPGSSSSAGAYPYNASHQYDSPSHSYQHLSDHPQRPRSNSRLNDPPSRPRSSSRVMDPLSRRTSASTTYNPRPRSPSPPPRLPYAPHSRSAAPDSILDPISQKEVESLKAQGLSNNPLRKNTKPPPPSWSEANPSPGLRRSSGPRESSASYFPGESHGAGPSNNAGQSSYGGDRRAGSSNAGGSSYYGENHGAGPSSTAQKRKISGNDSGPRDKAQGSNGVPDYARRKVSEAKYTGNNGLVADHYNSRQEVGLEARELSPIIGLRKFNNWIKSVLIGKFAHRPRNAPGANVLDLGCGKGGDLQKWKQARIRRMVGLDIAATSIDQARKRYEGLYRPGFGADFFAFDCFGRSISEIVPPDVQHQDYFDNVSMQFCMHYAFESSSKVRLMLENVTRYLRIGGQFIGTIPDSDLLLRRLNDLPEGETEFGNACFSVKFAERKHKGLYGHAYYFFLQDAVEDVPEYVIDWENFLSLAAEYGLQLVYKKAFNEILGEEQSSRDFGPLLAKMGVLNAEGASNMDGDQWEAANLYMGFAFEKVQR